MWDLGQWCLKVSQWPSVCLRTLCSPALIWRLLLPAPSLQPWVFRISSSCFAFVEEMEPSGYSCSLCINTCNCNTVILATALALPAQEIRDEEKKEGGSNIWECHRWWVWNTEVTLLQQSWTIRRGRNEKKHVSYLWLADKCNVNLTIALRVLLRLFQAPAACSSLVNVGSLILYTLYNAGMLCHSQVLVSIRCFQKAQCFIHLVLLLT